MRHNIRSILQDFSNALMINTVPEGHNSGRNYYLQASSTEECLTMVKMIKSLAKRARERAAAQTRFAKVQLKARKTFSSRWFQTSSATLIIAVRCRRCLSRFASSALRGSIRSRSKFRLLAELRGQHLRVPVRPHDDPRQRVGRDRISPSTARHSMQSGKRWKTNGPLAQVLIESSRRISLHAIPRQSEAGGTHPSSCRSTTRLGQMTDDLNTAFTFVFIIELLINLLGHWPRAFIHNPWVRRRRHRHRHRATKPTARGSRRRPPPAPLICPRQIVGPGLPVFSCSRLLTLTRSASSK